MKVTIASPIFYEPTASAYFMRAPLDFKPFVAHIIPPRSSDPLGNFAPVGVLGVFTAYFAGVSFSPNLDVTSGARTKRRSPTVHVIRDAQGTTCCPGKPLGRPLTAISPLTRSLEGATTLFRTRPLPCHHALSGNWAGSLISTRSHSRISSRTTEANASRLSAQIAKRWEPGLASNGVMVTIGFTRPEPHIWQRLAITGLLNRDQRLSATAF
jgi:hypothetical protein